MKSSGIYDRNKIISMLGIGAFVLASVVVIFLVSQAGGSGMGSDTIAFDTVDSSSCILCHTDESIIAASTWGEGQVEVEDTGG